MVQPAAKDMGETMAAAVEVATMTEVFIGVAAMEAVAASEEVLAVAAAGTVVAAVIKTGVTGIAVVEAVAALGVILVAAAVPGKLAGNIFSSLSIQLHSDLKYFP